VSFSCTSSSGRLLSRRRTIPVQFKYIGQHGIYNRRSKNMSQSEKINLFSWTRITTKIKPMRNNNGLTLLKLMFDIGIWSIIILISAPLLFNSIETQQEKQFFQTFQSDLLYIQNQSLGTDEKIQINLKKTSYEIVVPGEKQTTQRTLPDGWSITSQTLT